MFISFLYMFRAIVCPSSGEITVSMRHLVLVTLYGLLSGMQGAYQTLEYQLSQRYSYFSWWWAHSRPKHVEKRNKHTKEDCAPSWLYLQDYTGMHGQQNMKLHKDFFPLSQIFKTNSTFPQLLIVLVYEYWWKWKKTLWMLTILLTQVWFVTSHESVGV